MAGFTCAARLLELLDCCSFITGVSGRCEGCGFTAEVRQFLTEVIGIFPNSRFGAGLSFFTTRRKASLDRYFCHRCKIVSSCGKLCIVPIDLAFDHIAHWSKGHAHNGKVGLA